MTWLANLCYGIVALGYLPVVAYQMIVQRKNRRGWRERRGFVAPRAGSRPCVWIHAVSLGEVNATRTLVAELCRQQPGVEIVISATTDTGIARARTLYPDRCVIRYPLDFSWMVRRALRRVRPDLIILLELEVWFNFTRLAAGAGIPVCVVNGRMTERSCRRLGHIGGLVRPMFEVLSWVGAQSTAIAERFRLRGVARERVSVVGSLKWDTVSSAVEGSEELRRELGLPAQAPIVVVGSSGPGEEARILDLWERCAAPRPGLVLVPRKPERFDEVARLIDKRGHTCIRRSAGQAAAAGAANVVWLGDTLGELRKFYALATVVIIGRTLVPLGGSDPMEVAALGRPMLAGPHIENFADPVARFRAADAIVVATHDADLEAALHRVLTDPDVARAMGQRAREVVEANQGATARTVSQLLGLLRGDPVAGRGGAVASV